MAPGSQGRTSTGLLSCITVTALAGPNRSNYPFRWRCFTAHTCALSSGTAPVRLNFYLKNGFLIQLFFGILRKIQDLRLLITFKTVPLCSYSKGERREEAVWLLFCPSDAGGWETTARWDTWAYCPQGTVPVHSVHLLLCVSMFLCLSFVCVCFLSFCQCVCVSFSVLVRLPIYILSANNSMYFLIHISVRKLPIFKILLGTSDCLFPKPASCQGTTRL